MQPTILFDMDGVLIDSELHWDRLLPDFIQKIAPKFLPSDMHKVQGLSNLSLYHWLKEHYQIPMTSEEFLPWLADFADEIYRGPVALMPGVFDLIQGLHQKKITMAIVSSSPLRHIKIVRQRFGLDSCFPQIFSAEMVGGIGKPDPEVYLLAAKELQVSPKHCIAIEDSRNGIASARAAGMQVIALKSEQNQSQDLSQANFIVEGFHPEIRSLILGF
ncbi:MAG: HAD family hydrolase [Candidatus Cloacimonetes bacterium]|nr:HAD family hydrolase [Candidatus Cloacimonadota bacterium]